MNVVPMKTDGFGYADAAALIGGPSLSTARYVVEDGLYTAHALLRGLHARLDRLVVSSRVEVEGDPRLVHDAFKILEMVMSCLPDPEHNAAINEIETYEMRSIRAVEEALKKQLVLVEALSAMEILALPRADLAELRVAVQKLYEHREVLPEGEALWARCLESLKWRGLVVEWVKLADTLPEHPMVHTHESLRHQKRLNRKMKAFVEAAQSAPGGASHG